MNQTNGSAAAYEIQGVCFRYGSPAKGGEPLLKHVTFTIGEGEIVGILGPNGSGKTTLLKILAHLLVPQSGRVLVFGRELHGMSRRDIAKTVALVPQDAAPVFPFSIAEIVLMGRFPHQRDQRRFGWESAHDWDVVQQAMEAMDVAHLRDRLMTDVSGGERQRAIIARALAQEPRVLLLDEPTVFLDLRHQVDLMQRLQRLNAEQRLTIAVVSHDVNLVSQVCDRIVVMHQGRLVREGPPEEVIRPELFELVYGCHVSVDTHPHSGRPQVSVSFTEERTRSSFISTYYRGGG